MTTTLPPHTVHVGACENSIGGMEAGGEEGGELGCGVGAGIRVSRGGAEGNEAFRPDGAQALGPSLRSQKYSISRAEVKEA